VARHYGMIQEPEFVMGAQRFLNEDNWRRFLDPPDPAQDRAATQTKPKPGPAMPEVRYATDVN
jgi:hypothetical protein